MSASLLSRPTVPSLPSRTIWSIAHDCQTAWNDGAFYQQVEIGEAPDFDALPSVPYEDFMRAHVEYGERGSVGSLLVNFPADGTEENFLHTHPVSDRDLTILKGSGAFIALRNGVLGMIALKPGDRILMPKDIPHTFVSGPEGMLVRSIHSPLQELDAPDIVVRTEQQVNLVELMSGRISLPSLI